MNQNTVTLTLPADDSRALVAGATMLLTLAGKIPAIELDDLTAPPGLVHAPVVPATPTVPAPVPVAEQPAAAVPPAQIPGVHRDSDGLPWDARIHSQGKTLTADGRWRKKKGLDDAVIASVEAELRAVMAIPVPAAAPVPAPVPAPVAEVPAPMPVPAPVVEVPAPMAIPVAAVPAPVPVAEQSAPVAAVPPTPAPVPAPVPVPVAAVPPTPAPVPTPAPTAAEAPLDFGGFLKRVNNRVVVEKAITMDQVLAILAGHGFKNMQVVATRPDMLPTLWAQIEATKAA